MINKKRGYKSSRKTKGDAGEGEAIDAMDAAKKLMEEQLTPAQFALKYCGDCKNVPDFYASDYKNEFDKIVDFQKQFYPEYFTDEFLEVLLRKGKTAAGQFFYARYQINPAETKTMEDKKKTPFEWRAKGLNEQLEPEQLVYVLSELAGKINNSSGYLGAISDRSKELYFNKQSVGEFLYEKLSNNRHYRVRNQIFYRQDYIDEFQKIWNKQAEFHPELTDELKQKILKHIIFYQRPLKSCKDLIAHCEFEWKEIDKNGKKIIIGPPVIPKSSPLFQEFRLLSFLNNLKITNKTTGETNIVLNDLQRDFVLKKLREIEEIDDKGLLKLFRENDDVFYPDFDREEIDTWEIKFKKIKGDTTYSKIYKIIGDSDILKFDASADDFEKQPYYRLWHLLYSFAGDNSKSGVEKLIEKLTKDFGFDESVAKKLSNLTFEDDYGNLSAKAIRKLLPYMRSGDRYDEAATKVYGKHSADSLTRQELDEKPLLDRLEILPKNSLRNPVVEKILNQMVNVVNSIIDEYGKPDEIHIELARELKKSAKEREDATKAVNDGNRNTQRIKDILKNEPFNLTYVSRNDVIKYRLWEELKQNEYRTLYSNTYISSSDLFNGTFDIEHIIPQAMLYDDSYSNKTLELSSINREKSNETAYDYMKHKGDDYLSKYESICKNLNKQGAITDGKYHKLMMTGKGIGDRVGFIDRDLRDSQYISKKAQGMMKDLVRTVIATTGAVTDRLREDWGLIDTLKELTWHKYEQLGLTDPQINRQGKTLRRFKKDAKGEEVWTKRNDHRHHAMDALTVAFTRYNHINYLNYVEGHKEEGKYVSGNTYYSLREVEMYKDNHNNYIFNPPMPRDDFRSLAKAHLENILVSIKAKNKVTTLHKDKKNDNRVFATPRGQLHLETVYGSYQREVVKDVKVNAKLDADMIAKVTKPKYREALMKRLEEYNGDAKAAFTGKNMLSKKPIYLNELQTERVPEAVKIKDFETRYTTRKDISKDLNLSRVVDGEIKKLLEKRLDECGGDKNKAFGNIQDNPIYLNADKKIEIKKVTIDAGLSAPTPLHQRKDKEGNAVLDKHNQKMDVDYVQTGGNHHCAVFRDANGKLQEQIVSFYEAVARKSENLPIVQTVLPEHPDWEFLFTMKQNEYFIFPTSTLMQQHKVEDKYEFKNPDFNPSEKTAEWLMDESNYSIFSQNVFRVQKIAEGNYMFRHHFETRVDIEDKELRAIVWMLLTNTNNLKDVVKVRINHLGKIVEVGEY
jgi:CRISPR-associated endonuclease Csn1